MDKNKPILHQRSAFWDELTQHDGSDSCICDECLLNAAGVSIMPGVAVMPQKRKYRPVYRNTMDSCLLLLGRHNSNCGTMDLFDIIEEEYDDRDQTLVYARIVFRIPMHWIYNWFILPRINAKRKGDAHAKSLS